MHTRNIERDIISFVAKLAPWFGPVPTAYLIYERTQRHLSWPPIIAIAAALSIELLGVATSATALSFWTYERERISTEPKAPLGLVVILVAVYFVIAELLTVIIDVATMPAREIGAANLASALFPCLSLVSVVLLAVRQTHAVAFLPAKERKRRRKISKIEAKIEEKEISSRLQMLENEKATGEKERDDSESLTAHCEICGWRKNGYKSQRAVQNALNAHKCKTLSDSEGRDGK